MIKKIKIVGIFLFLLVISSDQNTAFAQQPLPNTFYCSWNGTTCNTVHACNPGYSARFPGEVLNSCEQLGRVECQNRGYQGDSALFACIIECAPGALRCGGISGNVLEQCNASGTDYVPQTDCASLTPSQVCRTGPGETNPRCFTPCTPGEVFCNSDASEVRRCKDDGFGTELVEACVTPAGRKVCHPFLKTCVDLPQEPDPCPYTCINVNTCQAEGGTIRSEFSCNTGSCCYVPSTGGGIVGSIVSLNDVMNNVFPDFKFKNAKLADIVGALIPIIFFFAGIALLFFLILGGFQYLTSQGDAKKVDMAKNTLTMAVVGFIIVIIAFWLTQVFQYVFRLGSIF
ncbi:hypothetical protein C4579_01500 [Candidatus Microgenomates bacterium]|nr:MAG: hypothetical protein C4579_01500 [Candidatus Microgenomates bacterium]